MTYTFKAAELLGRVLLMVLFALSGISKITSYGALEHYMTVHGVPVFLLPEAAVLEIGGTILVVLGWHTRIVATLLAIYTLLTIVLFHIPVVSHTEYLLVLAELCAAGGFLLLIGRGAGAWSLDARRGRAA